MPMPNPDLSCLAALAVELSPGAAAGRTALSPTLQNICISPSSMKTAPVARSSMKPSYFEA